MSNQTDTPTPRTDAFMRSLRDQGYIEMIVAGFARELERELARVTAERDSVVTDLQMTVNSLEASIRRGRSARAERDEARAEASARRYILADIGAGLGLLEFDYDDLSQKAADMRADRDRLAAERDALAAKVGTIKRAAMNAVGGCEGWPDVLSEGPKLRAERDRLAAEKAALENQLTGIELVAGTNEPAKLAQLLDTEGKAKAALEKRVAELSRDVEELRGEGENSRPTWSELQQSLILQRRATESNAQRVAALERERDELKAKLENALRQSLSAERSVRIYTKCPACQNDTLTVNDKHLLCTWIRCPDPTLIDKPEKLTEALAQIERLRGALEIARQTFMDYVAMHMAKQPPQWEKAIRNQEHADRLTAALAQEPVAP